MKYFDKLPDPVEAALTKRGVITDRLLYCVKADLDGEDSYFDVYITVDSETLHLISGYEKYDKVRGGFRKPRRTVISDFDVSGYQYIPLSDLKRLYVDRHTYTARLIAEYEDGHEECIAKFSLGFGEKFEKFCERAVKLKNGDPIDDASLDEQQTHCPICGERYLNPNRKVCLNCIDRSTTFTRLLKMFSQFKVEATLILICIAASTAFSLIAPYFGTKVFYDEVLNESGKYYGKILQIVLMMVAVNIASIVMRVIYGLITAKVTPRVIHRIRTGIFSSMQRLSLSFFTSKQTGSLMARIDNDAMNIYNFFTDIVPYALTNIVKLIGLILIMMYISVPLTIIIFAAFLLIAYLDSRFSVIQRKFHRKHHIAFRQTNTVLSDAMNGQRVVKAFAREDQEIARYKDRNNDLYKVDVDMNTRMSNVFPALFAIYRIASILLFCVGAWFVIRGHLLFGALSALISYADMAYEPVEFFMWIGDRWARCVDAASRMFEIMDATPTVRESPNPARPHELKGHIELRDVRFEYEAGRPIIKNVSLEVQAGQMFGIVGKTGAGKSTIINLISRLYDVTSGEILIDGYPLKELSFDTLRRNIGIVSQETYLFIGSVADNIRYARPDATMEEVIEAAKAAHAHDFIMKLPDAYDTKIGAGATSLSGGERQRISIARAIIQKPSILILDEATASMDTQTERKIQASLDNIKQGRTIISIAHRLSTLRDADMLCVIENGEVCEMGTHDSLIKQKGKYFDLYKLQAEALKQISVGGE